MIVDHLFGRTIFVRASRVIGHGWRDRRPVDNAQI
jgi:hypothetical protein